MKKQIIITDKAPKAIGPYSQAVKTNNLIFISGQIPINPEDGKIIKCGIKEQTKQVIKNIEAILIEAGLSLDNVIKTTCLLSDMNNFSAMNEVYATFFDNQPPARAAYEVSSLPLNASIEIEAIAVV